MINVPNRTYLFWYEPPLDRLQSLLTLGWVALWNGHMVYDETVNISCLLSADDLNQRFVDELNRIEQRIHNSFEKMLNCNMLKEKGRYPETYLIDLFNKKTFPSPSAASGEIHRHYEWEISETLKSLATLFP